MGSSDKPTPDSAAHGTNIKLHAKGLPPTTLPEFDPMTPEQEVLVKEFIAKHKPGSEQDAAQRRYASLFDNNWETISRKFLVSRKWSVAEAGKMYGETIGFRSRMRFHEKPTWPPAFTVRGYDFEDVRRVLGENDLRPHAYERESGNTSETQQKLETANGGNHREGEGKEKSHNGNHDKLHSSRKTPVFRDPLDRIHEAIGEYHPKVIHYWDKAGHPVWIEKIPGKYKEYLTAFKGALAPPQTIAEAWEEYHWHQAEISNIITRYQNRKRSAEFGRDITSITVVMDCADLGYGILFSDVARLSDKVWSQESKVVPESLHRIFVVNCPSIINIAFGLLKHVVPKRTQEKIVFCGKDRTGEVLRSVIDEDKLPKELGGTCECPGGCLGKART